MLLHLFIAVVWSPAESADFLTLVGDVYCIFVTFPCGKLGQVWYLILSFPGLGLLSYLLSLPRVKVICVSRDLKRICKSLNLEQCNQLAVRLVLACIWVKPLTLLFTNKGH